jgi:hypothetical protein
MVEMFVGEWTREQVKADKKRLYLFGDNLADMESGYVPTKTQAVIRGLFNAVGIPTKKGRGYEDSDYFWDTDEDFKIFKDKIDEIIYVTRRRVEEFGHTIVIPSGGIGTGRATVRGVFAKPGNRFKKYMDDAIATLGTVEISKDLIRIVNIKSYAPLPGEVLIRIDRQTPVGNPYAMKDMSQAERDRVCDEYQKYFDEKMTANFDQSFITYIKNILSELRNGKKVALGCWCAPLRCHGLTIKAWLEAQLLATPEKMDEDVWMEAVMRQIREIGEWVVQTRAGVTVEALRYGPMFKGGRDVFYVYHPGQSSFSLSEASVHRYIKAHKDALA